MIRFISTFGLLTTGGARIPRIIIKRPRATFPFHHLRGRHTDEQSLDVFANRPQRQQTGPRIKDRPNNMRRICLGGTQRERGRESFSGIDQPYGTRSIRKRLPTPSAKRDTNSFAGLSTFETCQSGEAALRGERIVAIQAAQ